MQTRAMVLLKRAGQGLLRIPPAKGDCIVGLRSKVNPLIKMCPQMAMAISGGYRETDAVGTWKSTLISQIVFYNKSEVPTTIYKRFQNGNKRKKN